jgi:hypothetical protein
LLLSTAVKLLSDLAAVKIAVVIREHRSSNQQREPRYPH